MNMSPTEMYMRGYGVGRVWNEDGSLANTVRFQNLISDVGDLYYGSLAIAGVGPAYSVAPTLVNGFKLGTSTNAATKNGAGAAVNSYLTGSAKVFDAAFPVVASNGAGLGALVHYRVTWNPGQATSVSINEIVLVTDATVDAVSVAASTVARSIFPATIAVASSQVFSVDWYHLFLGA